MPNPELVLSVLYRFTTETLFGDFDSDEYDIEESKLSFAELCRQTLRQIYPNARVIVEVGPVTCIEVNDREDTIEVREVELVCQRLYEDRKWIHLARGSAQFDQVLYLRDFAAELPSSIAVLRWACEHRLIKSVAKEGVLWRGLRQALSDFRESSIYGASPDDIWEITKADSLTYRFTGWDYGNVLERNLGEYINGTKLLIGNLVPFGGSMLCSSTYAFIEIEKSESKVIGQSWHFADIDEWSHPPDHSFSLFCNAFKDEAERAELVVRVNYDQKGEIAKPYLLTVQFDESTDSKLSLRQCIESHLVKLSGILHNTEIAIRKGPVWRREYEKDEKLFCHEVLVPLLRRMGFTDVDYQHGRREYGKDFTFTETTPFGTPRFYGLQAKKGDISGRVKGDMDEIIAQLNDAFRIPYRYAQQPEVERFISAFVIAISGKFSENAEEKLQRTLQELGRRGMVYLWDKNRILELISLYWLEGNSTYPQKKI